MRIRLLTTALLNLALLWGFTVTATPALAEKLTAKEQLGQMLFFDTNLSEPSGQGCVSCHHPDFGFADPDAFLPVSEGVVPNRFGTRNSPSAAYASLFPSFTEKRGIAGGQFWDGRAADLVEQAKGPFLNPMEMNNETPKQVILKVLSAEYADLFAKVCGPDPLGQVDDAYTCLAEAIAAFEDTKQFNRFDSKYDAYLAGQATLTLEEEQGLALFNGRAKCGHCHPAKAGGNKPVTFTDFNFHNIGTPANRAYPFDQQAPQVDLGLGGVFDDAKQNGRFKTPHLRNIELTPPYMHNGVLVDLKQVVHFYNTRDTLGRCDPKYGNLDPGFGISCWPQPEVAANLDSSFVGDLGLTDQEEEAVVQFMKTLTDGYSGP